MAGPLSTNAQFNEFGFNQLQRDIEQLYLLEGQRNGDLGNAGLGTSAAGQGTGASDLQRAPGVSINPNNQTLPGVTSGAGSTSVLGGISVSGSTTTPGGPIVMGVLDPNYVTYSAGTYTLTGPSSRQYLVTMNYYAFITDAGNTPFGILRCSDVFNNLNNVGTDYGIAKIGGNTWHGVHTSSGVLLGTSLFTPSAILTT